MNALATFPERLSRRSLSLQARRRDPHGALRAVARPLPGEHRLGADPLLTADEVAALLQVTKAWVYAQTRARRIPHVPLGRYVRYRRSAVLQWIAERERSSSCGARVPLDGG
jgi:excisionase family DNA binding protein